MNMSCCSYCACSKNNKNNQALIISVAVMAMIMIVFIPGYNWYLYYYVDVASATFDQVSHAKTKTKTTEKSGDPIMEQHNNRIPIILTKKCPNLLTIHGCSRWESNQTDWIFHNINDCQEEEDVAAWGESTEEHNKENKEGGGTIYTIPKSGPPPITILSRGLDDDDVSSKSKNNSTTTTTSIVFYGSSHIRELHLAMIRLKRGLHYLDELEDNVTKISGGELLQLNPRVDICDPGHQGWKGSKYGLDLYNCGLPKKRLVPELGPHIAIGFKTFLHTPDADQLFLEWLEDDDVNLRHPDVLIADVGIWGPRGDKTTDTLQYVMTLTEEIDYYLHWLRDSFPNTLLVLVLGPSDGSLRYCEKQVHMALQKLEKRDPGVFLLRKDFVVKRMPPDMECMHGCKGPVLTLLATIVMDGLGLVTAASQKCFNV